jgi:hypothetical protein
VGDDPNDREPLPLDPALLQLPSGYESVGDPVDENPFPAGSGRHELWARVTRLAEEKIARIKSDWLTSQATINRTPATLEEMEKCNALYREGQRQLLGAEFNVWAGRGAQVVFTDADVRLMDKWLVDYANACLDANARLMLKHRLPRHLAEGQLRWMKEHLAALVRHWQAENRRCRGIREEEARHIAEARNKGEAADRGTVSDVLGRAESIEAPVALNNRAAWFDGELARRGWSIHDLEAHNGPSWKTSRRVLEGRAVKETVLVKIARAFSQEARVSRKEIPND